MPMPEVILLSGFFLISFLEEVLYSLSRYLLIISTLSTGAVSPPAL